MPVPVRLGQPEPEELRDLFARRVVVSGMAGFRASGKLLSVDVQHIDSAVALRDKSGDEKD